MSCEGPCFFNPFEHTKYAPCKCSHIVQANTVDLLNLSRPEQSTVHVHTNIEKIIMHFFRINNENIADIKAQTMYSQYINMIVYKSVITNRPISHANTTYF